ncbi:outer membrane protein TolC [Acidipila rosea]|uniref:Outer membrane protein TolC n=2 Tax=Acidipila rosea TaxID=768535 RepID=A0A4V2PUJ7_9BACT|nr:outer membrane protein TolC [Acidipila rosea]
MHHLECISNLPIVFGNLAAASQSKALTDMKKSSRFRHLAVGFCLAACGILQAGAQSNPDNSAANAYSGSVQTLSPTAEVMPLSLDEAIRLGIQNNLALTLARQNQKQAEAQKLQTLNLFLPEVSLQGQLAFHQLNLAAQGFRPGLLPEFAGLLPAGGSINFPFVVKVTTQQGQINLDQTLFNWAGFDLYRALRSNTRAAYYDAESSRGLVVLNVGNSYLQALADQAQLDYARSLLRTDDQLLYQAVEKHRAGVVPNVDELRARVQDQQQQQVVIADEARLQKDIISLSRQIGVPPGQRVKLTETAPYADIAAVSLDEARAQAYANRQDYQSLKQKMEVARLEHSAAVHERLPTLKFGGNYGVTGVSGGIYHGTFAAMGTLEIPLFQEAKFRGDRDVAEAQLDSLRAQFADLRLKIEQQLRDSLLDLKTDAEMVRVARSNVELSTVALEQATERFRAGIDDNLPVTQAQSTLARAQAQYVSDVYRFNQTKLGFARSLGIIDTQYKTYLQGGHPPAIKNDRAAESASAARP